MNLLNIKNVVLAVALSLVVGFGFGFYTKGKFVKADQVEAVMEQRKEDVQSIQDMQKEEGALQGEIRESHTRIETIRKEIKKHVPAVVQPSAEQGQGIRRCTEPVLGLNVVSLLNAARDESAPYPAARRDAEGSTTAASED